MYNLVKTDKGFTASKINWTAIVIYVLATLADESTYKQLLQFGIDIPQQYVLALIRYASLCIILFRTFMTHMQNCQPGPDTGPTDVRLGKVDMAPFEGGPKG